MNHVESSSSQLRFLCGFSEVSHMFVYGFSRFFIFSHGFSMFLMVSSKPRFRQRRAPASAERTPTWDSPPLLLRPEKCDLQGTKALVDAAKAKGPGDPWGFVGSLGAHVGTMLCHGSVQLVR